MSKASSRMSAAQGQHSAVAELRDELARLRIPAVKAENIWQYDFSEDTLELWWWDQRGFGHMHNTLDKVLCRNMEPYDLEDEQILSIQLFYLPERFEDLPPAWKPWWRLDALNHTAPSASSSLGYLPYEPHVPAPAVSTSASAPLSANFRAPPAPFTPMPSGSTSSHTIYMAVEDPPPPSTPDPVLGISIVALQYCFRLLDGARISDANWSIKSERLEKQLRPFFEKVHLVYSFSSVDPPSRIRDLVLVLFHVYAERSMQLGVDKESLQGRVNTLVLQAEESRIKLSASEEARATAQTKEGVLEAKLAVARSKQDEAESKLAVLLDKFTQQELALSTASKDKERLQRDVARVEEERRKEQELHAKEREGWQVEMARMRAELETSRAENIKPLITPALMDAFLGIKDMAGLMAS
ncbi:unnamed protein product [Peniophora sp. CBMAI 1063]|nr:unnamed protein product [Peniophora sp. CBMAI 1063]